MSKTSRLTKCPQRCGGGLEQRLNATVDGRPRFVCTKCGHNFTSGKTGYPYAGAVPLALPTPGAHP